MRTSDGFVGHACAPPSRSQTLTPTRQVDESGRFSIYRPTVLKKHIAFTSWVLAGKAVRIWGPQGTAQAASLLSRPQRPRASREPRAQWLGVLAHSKESQPASSRGWPSAVSSSALSKLRQNRRSSEIQQPRQEQRGPGRLLRSCLHLLPSGARQPSTAGGGRMPRRTPRASHLASLSSLGLPV